MWKGTSVFLYLMARLTDKVRVSMDVVRTALIPYSLSISGFWAPYTLPRNNPPSF